MIVVKQLTPSTERRQKAKNTDCADCEMCCLSSDNPWEPAAESLNPGDHCGIKSPKISLGYSPFMMWADLSVRKGEPEVC